MRKDLDHHWGGRSKHRREAHGPPPRAMTFFRLHASAEPLRLLGCMAHTVTSTDWKWTLCREHASDQLFFPGLFHLRDSTNTYSSRCDHISLNCCDTVSRKCLLWVQDGKAAAVFFNHANSIKPNVALFFQPFECNHVNSHFPKRKLRICSTNVWLRVKSVKLRLLIRGWSVLRILSSDHLMGIWKFVCSKELK